MEQPAIFSVDANSGSVRFSGEIDISTAPTLIEAVLQSGSSDIDLSGITFVDSSGMHALIELKAARPSLRIVAASPTVRRLVQLTGLAEHLQVEIDA